MKTAELKSILQSPYSRKSWISTLQFLSGKRDLVTINLSPIEIDINTKEANKIVDQFHLIGSVKTTDNITLPIFEIILNKDIKIEHNRVAVNEFIKKYIIKDAIKGALVTFSYANVETEDDLLIFNADSSSKSEWRFSFISKNAANDFFAEAIGKETNPKKFTYIFGNNEAHRTAIERLYNLEQSRFRLDDFFEAFNVEPVSKKFFDEYKLIYKDLASYIYEIEEYKKVFTKISSDDEGAKREIRSFVGRLMGRIVFLYFLQKKNWLGASNTEFIDGSTSFLSDLFNKDAEKQNDFYTKYLCPIFFEALNTNRGNSQEFTLENGNTVCIPFLNGGLFEEEQEPLGHRNIKFRKSDFNRIFDFFNSYNFTVYENSPEEHTIAVDPEMLGHIFENLIDYNKETGTFYTPKEIVQYMTRESLIEYLFTNTDIKRENLESLVINQYADYISDDELKIIDKFLDSVKICDPAIGSGAFPVGMLQEIFNLKALINYRLKDKEWNPADIKQNIIQNSIYGVDIDGGAVEIARLRFWLSLVIDEGLPKPLPNLDFKIVVGNSLTSKFDLNVNINSVFNDFNNKISNHEIDDSEVLDIIDGDTIDVDFYKKIVNEYLVESQHKKKLAFKKLINAIKESFRSSLNGKEQAQLSKARGILFNLEQKDIFGNSNGSKKEIADAKKKLKELQKNMDDIENDVIHKDAIEWRFEFPHLLDDEANFIGFDILIGNPPYGVSIKDNYRKIVTNNYGKVPDFEIYYFFTELAFSLTKDNGVKSFIIPNTFLFNTFADKYRRDLVSKWDLIEILDCTKFSIFQTATVRNAITLWKKSKGIQIGYRRTKNKNSFSELISDNRIHISINKILDINQNWGLAFYLDSKTIDIINKIKNNKIIIDSIFRVSQGYIPYRRSDLIKQFGLEKGNKIVDDRLWHSDIQLNDDYLPEIFGRELDKFGINNKNKKSFIKYGKHVASYVDLDFFINDRVLVREITNPKIIATLLKDPYVNDPQLISIINKENYNGNNLLSIWAILNSKLATYFHFNNSPKATKGAFPKILIKDIKEFPIPRNFEDFKLLAVLVDYVLMIYRQIKLGTDKSTVINDLEDIIDALVFELYFPEDFKEKNIEISRYAEELFKPLDNFNINYQLVKIEEVYNMYRDKKNPLRNQILLMKIELKELINPILSIN
ncbi:Eco57I restriction-modification methylase domain-containing protein [Empedobacter falsenii]